MDKEAAKRKFEEGIEYLKKNNAVDAVFCFEEMMVFSNRSSVSLSYLGLAMAKANLDFPKAEQYCLEALKKQSQRVDFYRNMGEVYDLWGKKDKAVKVMRKGLALDRRNRAIITILKKLGIRKKRPISFLPRSSFLNKYAGLLKSKLLAGHH